MPVVLARLVQLAQPAMALLLGQLVVFSRQV
jgi:hypothetical protein